jgi:hypothetical protein
MKKNLKKKISHHCPVKNIEKNIQWALRYYILKNKGKHEILDTYVYCLVKTYTYLDEFFHLAEKGQQVRKVLE